MKPATVGELLHWSYANLAMGHAALTKKAEKLGPVHFMIRAKLYKGLNTGSMLIGPLAEDERLKMILPQACCYCGIKESLTVDHLIPTKRGGKNAGENLVWACRSCNSSKGAKDAIEWITGRGEFPPLLLLRRYLKLALDICHEQGHMQTPLEAAPELPFAVGAVPVIFPRPTELRMWVTNVT